MMSPTSLNNVCVPTKPCRRFTGFLCSWTVLCYFIFWLYWHDSYPKPILNPNAKLIDGRELLASNLQAPSKSPMDDPPHSSVTYPMTNFNLTFKKNKIAIDLQSKSASEKSINFCCCSLSCALCFLLRFVLWFLVNFFD